MLWGISKEIIACGDSSYNTTYEFLHTALKLWAKRKGILVQGVSPISFLPIRNVKTKVKTKTWPDVGITRIVDLTKNGKVLEKDKFEKKMGGS